MAEDATTRQLARLLEEITTLRAAVATLETELRGAQGRVDLTMRHHNRCRGCGCRRIAHAPKVLDRGESDGAHAMALYKPSWWRSRTEGHLEAYFCTRCGLTEWWVKDPAGVEADPDHLVILDHEPGDAPPFR